MSNAIQFIRCTGAVLVVTAGALWTTSAQAQVGSQALALTSERDNGTMFREVLREQPAADSADVELPARLRRQIVDYPTSEAPGTIVVDTPNTVLYFVLGRGQAVRYGIGVGRDGFTWSGVKTIERKAEWPDWFPPADMITRQPYLPRFMAGGPGNPLGARAMYLAGTVYRIHGTNMPSTIGKHVSSGCIRMLNADVTDLYSRAQVGTKVVVLPMVNHNVAQPHRTPTAPARTAVVRGSAQSSNLY